MKSIASILKTPEFKKKYQEGFHNPVLFVKHFLDEFTYHILVEKERVLPDGRLVHGHPSQQEWLQTITSKEIRETAVKAGSRSGKTFGLSIGHLWFLFYRYRPETNLFAGDMSKQFRQLAVAPSVDQARIVHDNIVELVNKSPFLSSIGFIKRISRGEQPELETIMNSVLLSRATTQNGRFILGRYYDFITFDEVASEHANLFIRSRVLSSRRLEVDGRIIYASTPMGEGETAGAGASGWRQIFGELEYRESRNDKSSKAITMTSYDNPVNEPAVIDRAKATMTQSQIAMEIYGEFARTSNSIFAPEAIDAACNRGLEKQINLFIPKDHPVTGDCLLEPDAPPRLKYNARGRAGCRYYHGLDTAGETKGDFTVLITLESPPTYGYGELNLAAFERVGKTETYGTGGIIERVVRRLTQFPGDLCYDATGYQGQLLRQAFEKELDDEMYARCIGISSNRKPGKCKRNYKELMLANIVEIVERGLLNIPFDVNDELKQLKLEMRRYQLPDKHLTTDIVMSLCLAAWCRRRDVDDKLDFGEMMDVVPKSGFGEAVSYWSF